MYEGHIWPDTKKSWYGRGSHVWALTRSAARLRSSKNKAPEVVFWVFTQVWVSVFRCIYTLTCPFTTQTNIHVLTHHWVSGPYFWWRTLSLFLFKRLVWRGVGWGAAIVWYRPVFSRGQTLARPEGGCHPITPLHPPTPEGGYGLGPLLNLHLLGELHFRYIVQAFLHIAERRRDVMFKSTLSDQSFFLCQVLRVTSIPGPCRIERNC